MIHNQFDSLKNFEKNYGQMLHNPGVGKLWENYSERLKAVIAAKGASTKYWLRGVNIYVNSISVFYIKFIF